MSVATKLEYLNDTKQLLKENINNLGGNLTNEPFRQYASVLEGIYERLPKISGIGASLSLSPSLIGKIKLNEIQGDTYQKTNLYNNDIEQGAISEGTDVSANNRIRTKGYIEVIPNTQLYIGFSGCDDMYVSYYNSSKTYVSAYGWKTGNANVSIPSNIYYIRVAFRKNDNSNITPSSISNVQIGNVPNPDYPQAIESVTGLQNVEVCGKNMLDTSTFYKGYVNSSGVVTSDSVQALFDYVEVVPSGTYTISSQGTIASLNIVQYDANKNFISRTIQSDNPKTFTLGNTTYYIRIWTKVNDSTPMTQEIVNGLKLQFEKGSATTYEPYNGNTYEVNLGKNLLDISTLQYGYIGSNGNVVDTHTAGEMYSNFIKVSPSTTYTFKIFETSTTYNNWFVVGEYSTNDQSSFIIRDTMTTATQNYITFTTSATTQYVRVSARNLENATKVQLEKGNGTSYSPYFTPIELNKIGDYQDSIKKSTGKQLFDKDNIETLNAYIGGSSGTITASDGDKVLYIPIKSNTTYTISKIIDAKKNRFRIGFTNSMPISGTISSPYSGNQDTQSSYTITSGTTSKYLVLYYYTTGGALTEQQILDSIMINEGSTALPYEPYGKVWYVEKNIDEVVLDGTESWETQWNGDNIHGWRTTIPNLKQTTSGSQSSYVISNNYETRTQDENFSTGNYGISNRANQSQIIIKNNDITSQNNFTTWLGTHNTTVLYQLETPIYEVITNTELIEQLELLYNAKSKNGTTNINVTSEDLSMILNVSVLKGE